MALFPNLPHVKAEDLLTISAASGGGGGGGSSVGRAPGYIQTNVSKSTERALFIAPAEVSGFVVFSRMGPDAFAAPIAAFTTIDEALAFIKNKMLLNP